MIIFRILTTIMSCLLPFYFVSKILNVRLCGNKFCFFLILFSLISLLCQYYARPNFPLQITLVWVISKIIWRYSIYQIGIAVLFSFITILLSEISVSFLFSLWLPLPWNFSEIFYCICNLLISIFSIFLFHFLSLKHIFQKYLEHLQYKKWFFLLFISILLLSVLQFYIQNKAFSFFSYLFILVSCILLIEYAKERMKHKRLSDDYQKLMNNVKQFEDTFLQYEKSAREYRYQLLLLQNILQEQGEKEQSYLAKILKEDISDLNGYLWEQLQKLQKCGLMGLFYYKINELQQKQIHTNMSIDFKEEDKVFQTIQDKKLNELARYLFHMFEYSTYLLEKTNVNQMNINAYHDRKNIYFSFTHPIGKNNLCYVQPNEKSLLLKEIIQKNLHFSRKEEIIYGIYTQTLIVHI